jgi:hypothetical protein
MLRFDHVMCAPLALSVALLGQGFPASAQAQSTDCEAYDHNGNGTVDVADVAPFNAASALLADCQAMDLGGSLECRSLDFNGNSAIDTQDQVALHARYQVFRGCLDASVAIRPECGSVDHDGDGRVSTSDYAGIVSLVDRFRACQGVDVAPLACIDVDYDGDGQISSRDQVILFERFGEYDACLGTEVGETDGLWISRERLMGLATRGPAWDRLFDEAVAPYLRPDLSDQDDRADTRTLAKALVGVRLSRADLIDGVRSALREVAYGSSDRNARTLSLGRALTAYVLSADIVDLAAIDPSLDRDLRRKLDLLRRTSYQGRSLVSTHEDRPNNWGTHAGAARVAIALYLGDDADLAAAAAVHRGFLGERSSYARFQFGALSWQADESRPLGINRRGAIRSGIDLDGAQPEEMRRGGPLRTPPARTGYPWEALQGATVTTELLARNGYPDAWGWGDHALVRAIAYLRRLDAAHGGWWASGDDRWNLWLVNHGAGTTFPTEAGVGAGKNMGFTDWTHGR